MLHLASRHVAYLFAACLNLALLTPSNGVAVFFARSHRTWIRGNACRLMARSVASQLSAFRILRPSRLGLHRSMALAGSTETAARDEGMLGVDAYMLARTKTIVRGD